MSTTIDVDPFDAPLEETPQAQQIQAAPGWDDIGEEPRKNLPARLEKSPKYPDLVRAMHALNWRQRKFVRLLPKANYVAAVALSMLPEVSRASVYRWVNSDKVKAAIALQMEVAGEIAGIDATRVVLQIADWAQYCREEVQLYSRDGKPLGVGRRDAANGLRALEMLAKHTGVIKPADNRSTVINNNAPAQFVYKIITCEGTEKQLAAASTVIDVEATEVKSDG